MLYVHISLLCLSFNILHFYPGEGGTAYTLGWSPPHWDKAAPANSVLHIPQVGRLLTECCSPTSSQCAAHTSGRPSPHWDKSQAAHRVLHIPQVGRLLIGTKQRHLTVCCMYLRSALSSLGQSPGSSQSAANTSGWSPPHWDKALSAPSVLNISQVIRLLTGTK